MKGKFWGKKIKMKNEKRVWVFSNGRLINLKQQQDDWKSS